MRDALSMSGDGFVQFGDGPLIPATDIKVKVKPGSTHRADGEREAGPVDIVEFMTARMDWAETVALAAQRSDPAPWSANVSTSAPGTGQRSGHGAGLVIASDDTALWDCESSNMLCMTVPTAAHVAYHDPARALREVAAGRALLREIEAITIRKSDGALGEDFLDRPAGRLLRAMASAHDEHPDYNPAWRVDS